MALISLILQIALVVIVLYFIYDYIQMPQHLKELTRGYNELVDQFQTAVKETAIAYIHI